MVSHPGKVRGEGSADLEKRRGCTPRAEGAEGSRERRPSEETVATAGALILQPLRITGLWCIIRPEDASPAEQGQNSNKVRGARQLGAQRSEPTVREGASSTPGPGAQRRSVGQEPVPLLH